MHHHLEQQTQRIDQNMPLAAIDLLAAVIAMRPALFGRLHRLAIDNGRAWRRLASDRATHALTQDMVNALPDASPSPGVKVVVDGGPRTVLAWHIAPGAARPQEIEDSVEDPSEVDAARTPTGLGRGEQGFEQGPFAIAEVTGIDA